MKKLTIGYHGNCFDGCASAALFERFHREIVAPMQGVPGGFAVTYRALAHRANAGVDDSVLDGDENGVVDFKYTASDRLTWWFDHHRSAFLTPADAEHFRADRSGRKVYDADSASCTKLIARHVKAKHGFAPPELEELIEWADIIDGARFKDAKTAVEMEAPAMKLMMVIESAKDAAFHERLIPELARRPLSEVVQQEFVASEFAPIFARHRENLARIQASATCERGVIHFDIADAESASYNKFIPYYLFPEARYSVGVSLSPGRSKVSVGSNPWCGRARTQDLAVICERYGGGGHAVVGAVSLEPEKLEEARQASREIAAELRADF